MVLLLFLATDFNLKGISCNFKLRDILGEHRHVDTNEPGKRKPQTANHLVTLAVVISSSIMTVFVLTNRHSKSEHRKGIHNINANCEV